MLRALLERDIVPDVVIGTSAGALNGAGICYAPNLTGVAQLAAVWEQLRSDHVFPGGKIHRAWNVVRRGTHLFESAGLEALIQHSTPARSFSDLEIPLRVIATDLDTGEEVVLVRGPLKPALLASTALPGVFPIVHHDGRRLVDGGVVDNVPLSHALAGPVDRVFVLNVSSGIARPGGAIAARRGDDQLHARPQPALRARAAVRAAGDRGDRAPPPARPARSVRLLGRARAHRRGLRARQRVRSTRPRCRGSTRGAAPALPPPPRTGARRGRGTPSSWTSVPEQLGGVLGEVEHAPGQDAEEQHRGRRDRRARCGCRSRRTRAS